MSEPMTPEREASIRSLLEDQRRSEVDLDDASEDLLNEVDRLRLNIAGLHARITELEASQAATIAQRDAQIIAWLAKKAREEGSSNKDSRNRADVLFRMADKLSRGAVGPPLSKGPDSIEYGIRVTSDAPDSEVLRYPGYSRPAIEGRLARHRTGSPDAHLLQRTVTHGAWTDANSTWSGHPPHPPSSPPCSDSSPSP